MAFGEIGGWEDKGGDWHTGVPDEPWEADALRVSYTTESGDTEWTTMLGPFPDFADLDEWEEYVDEWLDENNYGG